MKRAHVLLAGNRRMVAKGLLVLSCAAALGQAAPSGSPSFQARVEELARALQSDPRLKGLSEQQRIDRVEFVVGNTPFVLLHEMGHVLIAEMKLPVLGREEDAGDTFAALAMLKIGTSFSQRVLAAAAKGWFLSDRRDQQTGAKALFYDEHVEGGGPHIIGRGSLGRGFQHFDLPKRPGEYFKIPLGIAIDDVDFGLRLIGGAAMRLEHRIPSPRCFGVVLLLAPLLAGFRHLGLVDEALEFGRV
jgi:hypothetical protein